MTTTRRLNDSNKVIVTAALTGAVTTKQDNPYLPTQPKEIAEAALRCYEAGPPWYIYMSGTTTTREACALTNLKRRWA